MKSIDLIKKHFEKKRNESTKFSVRMLAKKVGISPSYLSLILNNKRKISLKRLESICLALDLDIETRNEVFSRFIKENGFQKGDRVTIPRIEPAPKGKFKTEVKIQTVKQFDPISDWYSLAIADCTLLRDYDGSIDWIAQKLGLERDLVENTLVRLLDHGVVTKVQGVFKKKDQYIEFRSSSKPENIRKHHLEFLKLAETQLTKKHSDLDLERRLITGMTLTLSEKKVGLLKHRINELLYEFIEIANDDPETKDVYRLSVQFFPVTD